MKESGTSERRTSYLRLEPGEPADPEDLAGPGRGQGGLVVVAGLVQGHRHRGVGLRGRLTAVSGVGGKVIGSRSCFVLLVPFHSIGPLS